jgi:hypothetical protein
MILGLRIQRQHFLSLLIEFSICVISELGPRVREELLDLVLLHEDFDELGQVKVTHGDGRHAHEGDIGVIVAVALY